MNEDFGFSFAQPSHAPKNPFESLPPLRQASHSSLPEASHSNASTQATSTTPLFGARSRGMFPFRPTAPYPLAQSTLPQDSPSSRGSSTTDGESASAKKGVEKDSGMGRGGIGGGGGERKFFQPTARDGHVPPIIQRKAPPEREPEPHHGFKPSPARQPSYHAAPIAPSPVRQPASHVPPASRSSHSVAQPAPKGHSRGWGDPPFKYQQPSVEDVPDREGGQGSQDTHRPPSHTTRPNFEYEPMDTGESHQYAREGDDSGSDPSSTDTAVQDGASTAAHRVSHLSTDDYRSPQPKASSHKLDSPSSVLYLDPEAQDGTPRQQMQQPSTLAHSVRQGQHSMQFQPSPPQARGVRQPESSPSHPMNDAQPPQKIRLQQQEAPKTVERAEPVHGHDKDVAAGRGERDQAGSSEQVLLSLLQTKNGEIDGLRGDIRNYQKLLQQKESSHDDLISQHQRLVESYAKDEETWKTSMGSAKRWKDSVKQKEYVKSQAMQALQESYAEQSSSYQQSLGELSRELGAFKSTTLEETQQQLSGHASTIGNIREALNQVKQSLTSHDIAVDELQNVKATKEGLEKALNEQRIELDDARAKHSNMELKLREYEETVGPDIKSVLSNLESMKAHSIHESAALQDTLRSLHKQSDKLSQKEKDYIMLQADYRSLQSSKKSVDEQISKVESFLSNRGCAKSGLVCMIEELEKTHASDIAECAKEVEEKEKQAAELQSTLEKVQKELEAAQARTSELQDSSELQDNINKSLTDSNAELEDQVASLQEAAKVQGEKERALKQEVEELGDAKQALTDRSTALAQKVQEAELRLQAAQTSLKDSKKSEKHLEAQVCTLSKQLEAHLKQQSDTSHVHDLLGELQTRMEQLKSEQDDAVELQRANTQILQKDHAISSIQSSLDNAHRTIDELNDEIRKLRAGFEQVSSENARIRKEVDEQAEGGIDLIERWERDQLSADEVVMVQRVTQQIKRGEQAFYRQELDEKANVTKKLEARCKKLESQISSLSHVKMSNSMAASVAPLAITEAVAVLSPYTSSSTSTVHAGKTISPHSPTKHAEDSKASFYSPLGTKSSTAFLSEPPSNSTIGRKRRLMDADVDSAEDISIMGNGPVNDEMDASVNEATFNIPPSTQAHSSTQSVTKPQKKTRFADILHSSTPPDSLPEDMDDPIEPATSQPQPQPQPQSQAKQRDGLPPPSQMPKTYKKSKTGSKSKVDSGVQGGGASSGGGDTRKLRGGRKSL
ncbi:hypothetical protein L198_08242 [Cryptococcus wingfieldii CBS 7118]|uniref:Uncharacterized protein n=1 Tax=Cryptococcus wingfieldii CBS 7118 TaxID=1295528 RepID=A0A1E3HD67_9TREE|nr:hypothetical protein L198_08242 [Cryptococcus wingfieldii CBS 7118]ODN74277.1 hypothetical protein L198_08242 [Cryptococcus wingfieldii CBS 7118]